MTKTQRRIIRNWSAAQTLCDYYGRNAAHERICSRGGKCNLKVCKGQEMTGMAINKKATTNSFRAKLKFLKR